MAVDDDYLESVFSPSQDLRGNVITNDESQDAPNRVTAVRTNATAIEQTVGSEIIIQTAEGGQVSIDPNGRFEYKRPTDFKGEDSFQYRVIDSDGSLSDWATVTFHVPAPDVKVVDDAYEALEVTSQSYASVLANDDAGLTVVTKVLIGTDTYGVDESINTPSGGTLCVHADGTFEYTAPIRHSGTDPDTDSFQYVAEDSAGVERGPATVTIDIANLVSGGSSVSDLSGTAGVDVFQWSLADLSGNDTVQNTVTQFNAEEGDKLDLRDLLQNGNDFLFDTDHLTVTSNAQGTTIAVTPVDASVPDLSILIEGVDLTGGYQGQNAIDHMISNGTLVDDK